MKVPKNLIFIWLLSFWGIQTSKAQVFFAKDTIHIEVLHPDGLLERYYSPYCQGTLDLNEKAIRVIFKPNVLMANNNARPHTDAWAQALLGAQRYLWSLDAVLPIDFNLKAQKVHDLKLRSRMGVIGETRWLESQWRLANGKSDKEVFLNLIQDFELNDPETGLPDKVFKVTMRVHNLKFSLRDLAFKK